VVPLVSGSPRSQETHRRASGGHGQRGLLPRCAASRFEVHKATLASVLVKVSPGIRLNEHIQHEDGEIVFRHACKLGLVGIASKRKDSTYRSGRSPDWLKMKNPDAPAVTREAEEDWGR
jgi:ATP-dependent DNA ligase